MPVKITAYTRRRPQPIPGAMETLFYSPSTSAPARLLARLAKATEVVARTEAPKRSGTLRARHRTSGVERGGATRSGSGKSLSVLVINDAPHAMYVHNGTGTWAGGSRIRGNPYMFWFNPSAPYQGFWRATSIAGQKANPWLVRAYNQARVSFPELDHLTPMTPNAPVGSGSSEEGAVRYLGPNPPARR